MLCSFFTIFALFRTDDMNFTGILIGAVVFVSIGLCHPLVIKLEYNFGKQSWWILLVAGLVFSSLSIIFPGFILSTIFGAVAFSCFWGIGEMFEQEKRVLRGWFPEKPSRHDYYEHVRQTRGPEYYQRRK